MHRRPDTIVGPTMVDSGPPGGHAGRSYRLVDEIGRSWLRRRGEAPTGTGFVSGAALLIESTTFARLDGFDERYFLFYEDIDLCLRANSLGVGTFVSPTWTVRHAGAHSTSARFAEAITWSYESGSRFHSDARHPIDHIPVVRDRRLDAACGAGHRSRSTTVDGIPRIGAAGVVGRPRPARCAMSHTSAASPNRRHATRERCHDRHGVVSVCSIRRQHEVIDIHPPATSTPPLMITTGTIEIEHVWKTFRIFHDRNTTLKQALLRRGKDARSRSSGRCATCRSTIPAGSTFGIDRRQRCRQEHDAQGARPHPRPRQGRGARSTGACRRCSSSEPGSIPS